MKSERPETPPPTLSAASSCGDECSCSAVATTASVDGTGDAFASSRAGPTQLVKGKATLELQVDGLCCAECALAVEKALARHSGVQQFRILSAVEKVQVDFDPSRVSAQELAGSISALGYKVHPTGKVPAATRATLPHRLTADTVRFAFVALIAFLEIGGESPPIAARSWNPREVVTPTSLYRQVA